MNIVLIGFMGVGKTTIGRKLARRLGYYFLDMDHQIEQEQGCSIAEIFDYAGESCFRNLETQLLQRLISVHNTVLSTGGGIITTEGNIQLMKKIGKLVYLKAPVEVILARLENDTKRPLLRTENAEEKIRTLLEKRSPLYAQADYVFESDQTPIPMIITQIILAITAVDTVSEK
ncbi:shikimate kinase [Deltaproteobacteria bacterium TL4]